MISKNKINLEEKGDLLDIINGTFGKGTLIKLDDEQKQSGNYWSTNIHSIDYLLGGGLPKGKMVELYGNEGSGKTTLALQIIKSVMEQEKDKLVVYIDTESALNYQYCKNIGIDLGRFLLCQTQVAEEVLNIIKKIAETNSTCLIVVDSVAGLVPEAEIENIGDFTVASLARVLSSNLRKLAKLLSEKEVTVLFINQLRSNVNISMFGPATNDITCGGKSLKYYSSIRIELINSTKLKDHDNQIIGAIINVKTTKNKFFPPFRTKSLELYYGKGFDYKSDLLNYYIEKSVIIRNGAWYSFNGENIAKGKENMLELLSNNDFCSKLKENLKENE